MQAQIQNKTLIPASRATEIWVEKHEGETVEVRLVSAAKRRSIEANAKYHTWCYQIEQEQGLQPGEAHRYNKYHIGLPILTRDNPEHRGKLKDMMLSLDYDQRLQAMDFIDCTKLFTVRQFNEFMDNTARHWAENAGIELE